MKKTLFSFLLAAAGLATVPSTFAQSTDTETATQAAQQGWYLGAEIGYGEINKGPYDAQGDAIGGLKGGYRFALNPDVSVGVEAGFQYLGHMDARYSNISAFRSKLYGPTLGANMRYYFTPNWYGEARAGAFYAQGQGLTDNLNPTVQRFNRVRYYAGVGVGYNIDQNWSVGLNYNYYDGSGPNHGVQLQTNAYTASVEYRF